MRNSRPIVSRLTCRAIRSLSDCMKYPVKIGLEAFSLAAIAWDQSRPRNRLFDLPRPKSLQSNVNVLAQKVADFHAVGFREQVGAQESCSNRVRLIKKGLPRGVEVGRCKPKRERENECQQA